MAYLDEIAGLEQAGRSKNDADIVRTAYPIVDPVTVAETKDYLRITETGHDSLLGDLITTATTILEDCYGIGFLASSYRQVQNLSPRSVKLLRFPVLSVTTVKYIVDDSADTELTLASSQYSLVQRRAVWARTVWPSHRGFQSFIVNFKVGYGDAGSELDNLDTIAAARAAVPENGKRAIMQLAGHLYENPEGQGPEVKYETQIKTYGDLPLMVQRLMQPWLRKNGVF
jgi:uncharacterized phiE125 gp8 family phage protein